MMSTEYDVACSAPYRAMRWSHEAKPALVRIIANRMPMPTAAPDTVATATDSATPVSVRGSKWRRRWSASLGCTSTSWTIVVAAMDGASIWGHRRASRPMTPPTSAPAPTAIATTITSYVLPEYAGG